MRTISNRTKTTVFSYLLLSGLLLSTACRSARQPVPPGTIPPEPRLTADARREGSYIRSILVEQFSESPDPEYHLRVQRVLRRLLIATGAKQPWQVTILEDETTLNAAATRGNQLFIWTGMLDALEDDGELAAVLGHEIAHVLAEHVDPNAEEFEKSAQDQSGEEQPSTESATNVAAEISNPAVPYSQELELEADHIGMMIMAEAGYDPEQALSFWRRSSPDVVAEDEAPHFFSTHPNSQLRLEALAAHLPEALSRYGKHRPFAPVTVVIGPEVEDWEDEPN